MDKNWTTDNTAQTYRYGFIACLVITGVIESVAMNSVIPWKSKKWDNFALNTLNQNLKKVLLELKFTKLILSMTIWPYVKTDLWRS